MKKKLLVKTLALGIVVLFISVSFSSAISVDTKTPVINNQSEENKSYIDPNIHLTRTNLPILKRSFKYFKNSKQYDVEIGKVMEQIIKLIELKGNVNSEDVENILKDNKIAAVDVHTNCEIMGDACGGMAFTIPLLFTCFQFWTWLYRFWPVIGIGQFLFWKAYSKLYCSEVDIELTVGVGTYTTPHICIAFGYSGIGFTYIIPCSEYIYETDFEFEISGHVLIAFILPRPK